MNTSKLILGGLLISMELGVNAQGVLISPGNDYTINIPSLDYIGPDPQPGYFPQVTVIFTNNWLDPGENIRVSFYEQSNPGTPVSSFTTLGTPTPSSISGISWRQFAPPLPNPDLPSFATISMLSGSLDLYSLSVTEILFSGGVYSDTFVVPEPYPSSILLAALSMMMIIRKKSRSRAHLLRTFRRSGFCG